MTVKTYGNKPKDEQKPNPKMRERNEDELVQRALDAEEEVEAEFTKGLDWYEQHEKDAAADDEGVPVIQAEVVDTGEFVEMEDVLVKFDGRLTGEE
jgi:hypothetical protein